MSDKPKRAIIIHRCTKAAIFDAPLQVGQDLRKPDVFEAARIDYHRIYYGWYKGLQEMGWEVVLIDRPSYVIPDLLRRLSPRLYVKALHLLSNRLFFSLRVVDSIVLNIYLILLIWVFRPRLLLFDYDTVSGMVNLVCRRAGIRTVSYFGIIPLLARRGLMDRELRYDRVISGYELDKLWPEISAKYDRIPLGPSRDSRYRERKRTAKDIDVCLIGNFDDNVFRTRSQIVDELLNRLSGSDIEIHLYGGHLFGREHGLAKYKRLDNALRGRLYGDRFYETFHRTKIMLTIPSEDHMREGMTRPQGIMEPAAAGVFQLVYDSPDARTLFRAGTEIEVFGSLDELEDKIRYYLEHDSEREHMAQRAFERYLSEYTAEQQIAEYVAKIGL